MPENLQTETIIFKVFALNVYIGVICHCLLIHYIVPHLYWNTDYYIGYYKINLATYTCLYPTLFQNATVKMSGIVYVDSQAHWV